MAKLALNELLALTVCCGLIYGGCNSTRQSKSDSRRRDCYENQLALQDALTKWLKKHPSPRRPAFRDFCINTRGNVVQCPSQESGVVSVRELASADVRLANQAIAEHYGPDPKPHNFLCPERRDRIGLDELLSPSEVHFRLTDERPEGPEPAITAVCIRYGHFGGPTVTDRLFTSLFSLAVMMGGWGVLMWLLSMGTQPATKERNGSSQEKATEAQNGGVIKPGDKQL
jgi:hypothetical protein